MLSLCTACSFDVQMKLKLQLRQTSQEAQLSPRDPRDADAHCVVHKSRFEKHAIGK